MPHLPESRILQIAESAAARAGDRDPTLIQHSEGHPAEANLVASGDQVARHGWSYLIAERGLFVLKDASRPAGAGAPRGSALTLIVDADTGEVTDGGVSDRYPRLATLGPVSTDLRQLPPGCLQRAPAYLPSEAWPPAQTQLAPPGASTIQLCRYNGLNTQPPLALDRMRLLRDPALIDGLVGQFDMLPPPPHGPVACPSDDGSEIVALLGYTDGRTVTISVGLTGCHLVTNGSVHRTALSFGSPPAFGPQLVSHLERLLAGGVTPSEPVTPTTCTPTMLRLAPGGRISPQTGEQGRAFTLTNRSTRACRLSGYPRLAFYHGRHRLNFRLRGGGGGYIPALRPRPVLLAPGGHAYFLAAKYRCDSHLVSRANSIHMTLPHAPRPLTANISAGPAEGVSAFDYCRRYPGDARIDPGNYVHVTPIVVVASLLHRTPKPGSPSGGRHLH